MKTTAKDLKEGQIVRIAGQKLKVRSIEFSEIGKQGKRKCRLELTDQRGEKTVLIRPEDYPFDIE